MQTKSIDNFDPRTGSDDKKMAKAHEDYPDIFPQGLASYPFARSRIEPIIYEIADGSKVLDVGCNSGEFIKHLKERKGCDVYGFDISAPMIELCKSKGLENCFQGDADKLPFPDNTFDYVTLMEVLEHFDDPVKCLKEIRRVLKKNGVFLGTCPHANLERYVWDDERLHQQYYTEESLTKDLKTSFKKVYLKVLTGAQYVPNWIESHLATEPAQMLFKAGGSKCEDWDEQLRKVEKVRTWWGFTQLQGVCYYRMRGFAEKMDKYGIESAFENFKYDRYESQVDWQRRISGPIVQSELEGLLRIADVSVWQVVGNRYALAFLWAASDLIKKPIVLEVDDWLFDLPSYNIGSNPFKPNSDPEWIAYTQIQLADYVVCSTEYIKDGLLNLFPNKQIYVVPNSIDFNLWDSPPSEDPDIYPKDNGVIRIGYSGCGNHEGDLELIKRPLEKIMEEYPNVELITYFPFKAFKGLPRVKYTNKWVTINKFPDEMKRWKMDIGIAPLRDNDFNRAKSNLRWLEYSALKVPTIASNVYPFQHSVTHEKTGLLCGNSDLYWYEALKDLIVNEGKRIEMGKAAYEDVKTRFNMDHVAAKYAEILKEIKCKGQNWKQRSPISSETPITIDGQLVSSEAV